MASRPISVRAELSALVLLVLLPRVASAAWPSDPTVNVPLCVYAGAQRYPEAAPDATGGAIVAWDDQRGGPRDIFVQRVNGAGVPRWTMDGVNICNSPNEQYEPKLIADGSGGAIVTWSDYRNGVAYDIYAQRVDSTGTPKWAANGVAICNAANFQSNPAIVSDGAGGAIITWDDDRNGTGITRIYAQRVNASGVPQWIANGVMLTTSGSEERPLVVSNGASGALVCWEDYRNGEWDVFAQRILSNGTVDPSWPAAGLAVALSFGDQEDLAMTVDGSGGAFIGYAQWGGGLTRDIYVKHALASGSLDPAWPSGGRAMLLDSYDQASTAMVADGATGAIVTWDDQRGGSRNIFAQHVLSTGALDPAWPDTGVAVCVRDSEQVQPRIVTDGAGGAIVTWLDSRNDEGDIYAQHVMNTGVVDPAWPSGGRGICTASRLQVLPAIVSNGAGGAVIAWQDRRANAGFNGEDEDIYAQGVKANGQLGDNPVAVSGEVPFALALEAPSPNPARGSAMMVRFALPRASPASLELLDIAGRRVTARDVGSLGAGPHAIDLAARSRTRAGIYFIRLRQGDESRVQRVVVLDE